MVYYKSMKKTLLALSAAALAFQPLPSFAQSNLQWRTTTCNIYYNGAVGYKNVSCKAGFAYDTAVRQILFYNPPTKKWLTWNTFTENSSMGNTRECIRAWFSDGTTESVCTVPTPEQLGIIGD